MSVPIKDNERFQFLILPVLPDHTSFVSLNLQKILINNTQQQFIWSKTLVSFFGSKYRKRHLLCESFKVLDKLRLALIFVSSRLLLHDALL